MPNVSAPLGIPRNAATGRCYSGINVLILWGAVVQHGYFVQSWLTFRQALGLGGNVRKGERGTTVVYADRFVPNDECQRAHDEGETPRSIPFLKRFTVFNAEQCEGLPVTIAASAPPVATDLILPQVETFIRASGADLRIGGDRTYYDVPGDFIRVPPPQGVFSNQSTGTAPPCMSSPIIRVQPIASTATCLAPSVRRNTARKRLWPK